jgi:transcriptional regulator GlxA family with amidase domain
VSGSRGTKATPIRLAFLLVPQFSMMSFSAALEPLRSANRQSGRSLYEWQLVSVDGKAVEASNGIEIDVDASVDALGKLDMLVACVSLDPIQHAGGRRLLHTLRRLARHGCRMGAISGGTFLLAQAGLLAERRCTVHWEFADLFRATYPHLDLVQDLYVVDRDVFTCSGGTAALDLMLHFVREHFGAELAISVAEQFLHPRIREHGDHQRMDVQTRYGVQESRMADVIRLMESTLSDPIGIEEISRRVGLSARQVERLFVAQLGMPPGRFYLSLRLERARLLLQQGSQSVREVAFECGFASSSHFCHVYRDAFNHSPTADRRRPLARP